MGPKILVFGLPRTGTQSMCDAVEMLGYKPTYHMREVEKSGHIDDWVALLDQKYGQDPPSVDVARLKRLVDDREATADFPAATFAPELIQLYPDAKIILTRRDEDAWVRSMENTLIKGHTKPDVDTARPMYPIAQRYHTYAWRDDFAQYGRTYYRNYWEEVERLVEGREVLRYRLGDGWEPICEFLGVAVPDEPYPRTDEATQPKK